MKIRINRVIRDSDKMSEASKLKMKAINSDLLNMTKLLNSGRFKRFYLT